MNEMHNATDWDDLTLTAYIDGELDAVTQASVLDAMEYDKVLREQVCRLRRTKDWMRTGYGSAIPPTRRELTNRCPSGLNLRTSLAAGFMALAFGLGGGLLGYACAERDHPDVAANLAQQPDPNKIVLHIDDSDPAHFKQLLDYTEAFLTEHRDSSAQVEVIANSGGLNLLRVDTSPYAERVKALSEAHANVRFIACMNAVRNLRRTGVDPLLIDDVHSDETAVDHIVKRLLEGWTYQKITDLNNV